MQLRRHPQMLRRRFHISDILSMTTGQVVSRRGTRGVRALCAYMAERPYGPGQAVPFTADPYGDALPDAYVRHLDDFRAAILTAYPELSAYEADDVPPSEFRHLWVRRRAAEFGEYLELPHLAPAHPLRAGSGPVAPETGDLSRAAEGAAELEDLIEASASQRLALLQTTSCARAGDEVKPANSDCARSLERR